MIPDLLIIAAIIIVAVILGLAAHPLWFLLLVGAVAFAVVRRPWEHR